MGLTRPKIWDIDTNIEFFNDPITVLHQGATTANVDVGFLFNRANGLVSNVAVYWSESLQSFVTTYTTSTGVINSNIVVTSYANLTIGSLFSINGNIYLNGSQGTPGQYITATSSGTAWTSSSFTGGVISSTTYPSGNLTLNLGTTTAYWANVYTGNLIVGQNILWGNGTVFSTGSGGTTFTGGYVPNQSTFGANLVANSGVASTSTTTGALVVAGGAGVSGNLNVGGNVSASNFLGNIFFGPTPTTTYYNQAPLNLTNSLASGIKTQLNLINTGGGAGAGAGIDFYTYTSVAGSTYPESRIAAVDDGSYSSYITFQTKIPGNTGANALAERLKIDSAGNIVIPTTTTSTSTTTGALVVAGGVGITGAIYAGSIQGTPIGSTTPSTGAFSSFKTTQNTVTIGTNAGLSGQGTAAVAVGLYAGYNTQGAYSVAIGNQAGQNTAGQYSVLAGYSAGFNSTSANVVSIGPYAGYQSAAINSVAIGNQAGYYQTASSIVINATGNQLNGNVAGFVVAPVRNDNGNISLQVAYNTTTNEFTYSNTISVANATIVAGLVTNLTITGNLTVSGNITSATFPLILNDISSQFNANCTVFALKNNQTAITNLVDSKDLSVVVDGRTLSPYVTELRYPWITPYNGYKGFRVATRSGNAKVTTTNISQYVVIYNAPDSGQQATVTQINTSATKQTRRYPYSASSIALGD